MKYYLLKQLNYKKVREEGVREYISIDINDKRPIISRTLILTDKDSNKLWYCFVYTPEPKLDYVSKSNRQSIEENLLIELNNTDKTIEGMHEVSKEIVDKFMNYQIENNYNDKEKLNHLKAIVKKLNKLNKR